MVGVTFCTCRSTMEELKLPGFVTADSGDERWLGLAGSAGRTALCCLLGSRGVAAEEEVAAVRGEPEERKGGRELRSSSDFFLPARLSGASTELDREGGLYKLDVDLAFVIPDLAPNLRPVPEPGLASNSFLVCLTMSGAGSSLSLTPNSTPVEALLEGRVLAPAAALTPP